MYPELAALLGVMHDMLGTLAAASGDAEAQRQFAQVHAAYVNVMRLSGQPVDLGAADTEIVRSGQPARIGPAIADF